MGKNVYRLCLISLPLLLLVGCTSSPIKQQKVGINFSEPHRIHFQGKGAGAGIALMSTMGPVGIALGVAIDEGIAKDIREPAANIGFDMQSYLSQSIEKYSHATWKPVFVTEAVSELEKPFPNIEVTRYGFKTTGGENDATSAELVVRFNASKDKQFEFHYPRDFVTDDSKPAEFKQQVIPSYPLADLKLDGALSVLLMSQAVDRVIEEVLQQHLSYIGHKADN